MEPKWLIEKDVFNDNHDKIVQTIRSLGMQVKVCQYVPFDGIGNITDLYSPDDCVIFYGSLNLGEKLRKIGDWIPGVYLKEREYECTSYYPILGDMLLHQNYIMMPYGDLIRQKFLIFDRFFKGRDKIFIRPNSGNKQFTGMVVPKWNYEECIKLAGFYDVEPDLLVLVSDVHPIEREWRFVVINQKIVSGSLYRDWSSPEKISSGVATKDYVLISSYAFKVAYNGCGFVVGC